MGFKKIIGSIHLWLGLLSGLVVEVVSLTGCMYVFRDEILWIQGRRNDQVTEQHLPLLPPSNLLERAEKALPGKPATGIYYEAGYAAAVGFNGTDYNLEVLFNPYSGERIRIKDNKRSEKDFDFFAFVLNGHMYLWLPWQTGRYVVGTAILLFVVLLLTGLVLWWPKDMKRKTMDQRVKVNWRAKFKRLNYALHNVLGFYVFLFALTVAVTGLVYVYEWLPKTIYWVASGGERQPTWQEVQSDTTRSEVIDEKNALDSLWQELAHRPFSGSMYIGLPQKHTDAFFVSVNPKPGTFYRQDIYYFDRYNLHEIKGGGVYSLNRYDTASLADKGDRLNYDLHNGAFGGLPTKILYFFGSLVCASLPVTGFLIWYNRKRGKRKSTNNRKHKKPNANNPITTR